MRFSLLIIVCLFASVTSMEWFEYPGTIDGVVIYNPYRVFMEPRSYWTDLKDKIRRVQLKIYDTADKIAILARDNFDGIHNRTIKAMKNMMAKLKERLQRLTSSLNNYK
uniref:Uncharacterized protein n=1 Tax=Graphocephala atropunctata TaxID=36148 RepID=A0A1B6KH91_9HEMI